MARKFKVRPKKAARGSKIFNKRGQVRFKGRGLSALKGATSFAKRILGTQIGNGPRVQVTSEGTFNPDDILKVIEFAMDKATMRIILEWQKSAQRMLSRRGSGKLYRGGAKAKGSKRRRSAPGEPPAVDTGELLRSVQTASAQPDTDGENSDGYQLSGVKWYGVYLDDPNERGSNPSNIAARPWIKPSIDAVMPIVERISLSYINDALNKATQGSLGASIMR